MSTPILPFAMWESGTNQNSVPANDNSLRNQILGGLIISDSTDAQPGSPVDGDAYIMTGAATGTQWATFDQYDLAIFDSGTWYAFAPVEGIRVNIAGTLKAWNGSAYVAAGGGSGDVVGPASATDGHVALFDTGTGKLLKDGGALALVAMSGDADDVAIADAGGYFTSTDVEGALQELGAGGGGGGLTGFTSALNTSSPNNLVNASSLIPSGGTTNQVGVYSSKGNGAIQARVADSLASGGNARGANAVDWQQTRLYATQVASAQTSTISGGTANTASNSNATVSGGSLNNASGNYSSIGGGASNAASTTGSTIAGGSNNAASGGIGATICGGDTNTASNTRAFVGSGFGNVASGEYSWIPGGIQGTTRGTWGAGANASGQFAAVGDAQHRSFVLRSDTTNATPEAVSTDNSTAAAANQIVLPNNSAFMIKGSVVCRENATGDTSAWEFTALIKRGANAASTALVAAATISTPIQDAGAATWTLGITANTTLGGLTITVTGEASHNIKWVTDVYSCCEVAG